ncbi:hypothetical protein MBLNU457_5341t1 [Dothideomycetes sp. NU457]
MSEYWKSTPKYWCKFCETYVRDTPNDRKQHEQTGKHQGGIQKSLRELHKRKEQDEREKQRAQGEVARLKRLAGEKESPKLGSSSHVAKTKPSFTAIAPKATAEDRRRQMEQLAAMGVAVPEEFKRDMAIVSEWSTVSETPIYENDAPVKSEDGESKDAVGAFGVRKRKLDDEEAEVEQAAAKASRKNWGSTLKAYPGAQAPEPEADLDALLAAPVVKKEKSPAVAEESAEATTASLKKEESTDGAAALQAIPQTGEPAAEVKNEDDAPATADPPIVFKKRKGKR